MVTEPKQKRSRKAKRRHRPREEIVYYVVAIEHWDWGYSFSLNGERQPIDPYNEFRHLHVRGRLLHPKGLKTERIELTLLPSRDLEPGARTALRPLGVGSLDCYGDPITGLLSLPEDALPPILQMMIGDRFKFVVMHGTKFTRWRATLHGFRLETKVDSDDLPEGVELPD
ncbi:hypothetical protein GPL17_19040 [Bradyrhizobium yuanmingense]|uniref:hypothetical protein n=1 Tax=Bradyrhizobium yuanmingense TaxID=108015 RepID=UPI0012FA3A00|nr:hypothetical protein [Bradyrhizobium yuanmingense]MVT52580.1 hypothetical protein [Bradyrhizobium yuanmingense]